MITLNQRNRVDPAGLSEQELAELAKAFAQPGKVMLIDEEGHRTQLPRPVYEHLSRLVGLLRERKAIVMMPEEEAFTTQAAANFLGMSRQHLVGLLDRGEIPSHRVGTHRRVTLRDLHVYTRQRDSARRRALDGLASEVDDAGLYDSEYTGED